MISSINNAAVRKVVRLRKRRERLRRALMIVEGHAAVTAALNAGVPLLEAFHSPGATRRRAELVGRLKRSPARVSECADGVLAFIAGTDHPPDVIAVAPLRDVPLAEAAAGAFPVVLSEIRDPAVAGGIMAAAAGAGATSVITTTGTADVFSPAATRAAAGAHFVLPAAFGHDPDEVASTLGRAAVRLVVLTDSDGIDVTAAGLKPPLALIVCGDAVPGCFSGAERVTAGASSGGVGPGIGARAAIALEEVRRGAGA